MAEAILDALGPVLTRWTMGGAAATVAAPAAWRDALGDDPAEAELRLLALSGQYLGTLILAGPVGEVRVRADIPRLAHPPIPDPLRPRARRVLGQLNGQAARRDLLDFLERRGRTLHPGDWMPGPNDDVPAVYGPWQDWATASDETGPDRGTATVDDWDDLGPAGRRAAFASFRRQDAAAASAFLADRIGAETPDLRVRLLEAVATGLSDADRPLLDGLAGDRAPRVKALAASLLARLGHGGSGGEDVAELAAFFAVQTKGLLRRTRIVVAQPLKTAAQHSRRTVLMEAIPLDTFAEALGLSPTELIDGWQWHDDRLADRALAVMAARSARDDVVGAITDASTRETVDPDVLAPLLPRLSAERRRAAAIRLIRSNGGSFVTALSIAGGDGGIDDAVRSAAGTSMIAALNAEGASPAEQSAELVAIGLLASRAGARQALDRLTQAGLTIADPRLDMLRLNAALDDTGS